MRRKNSDDSWIRARLIGLLAVLAACEPRPLLEQELPQQSPSVDKLDAGPLSVSPEASASGDHAATAGSLASNPMNGIGGDTATSSAGVSGAASTAMPMSGGTPGMTATPVAGTTSTIAGASGSSTPDAGSGTATPAMPDAGPADIGQNCARDADCRSGYCNRVCSMRMPYGGACSLDRECVTGHCRAAVCCNAGDCCTVAADCPASYSSPPSCDDRTTCQGTRKNAVCSNSQCGSIAAMDDSACTSDLTANDCGAFVSVLCTGARDQPLARCPTSCRVAHDCDLGFWCDAGSCKPAKANGQPCETPGSPVAECERMVCGPNKLCCNVIPGSCCNTDADCHDPMFEKPHCLAPTCTGLKSLPACVDGLCQESDARTPYPEACAAIEHVCYIDNSPVLCSTPCRCVTGADCRPNEVCMNSQCIANSQ